MKLILADGEMNLQLEILNWKQPEWNEEEEFDEDEYSYCTMELSLQAPYLDYAVGGTVWNLDEVVDLRNALRALLNGELYKPFHFPFLLRDIEVDLHPSVTVYGPNRLWNDEKNHSYPIRLFFYVTFRRRMNYSGTAAFRYQFGEFNIRLLYQYLQFITGELSGEDFIIQEMIRKGQLI